ncbi:MAG TPA: DEAD/DEAH box helicase [Bryobacteraceae bacterium]|nr:DEAD/DEAH box helicase [Bryobacteraceae bacterium]
MLHSALGLGAEERLFPWQEAVLDNMRNGVVPEIIEIPTGLGKTSVIAIWLVARACGANLPRRLVYCLPMRVLVEQTRSRALQWAKNVGLLAGQAQFNGNRLEYYRIDWSDPNKVAVVTLMGGEAQSEWREYPEHPAIIIGTQDMLLSRALNRGFAMKPQLWPVDFGFLNVDTLWVMDEVQLMGAARTTSVQLQHFWEEKQPLHGSRRSVWMSATLGSQPGSCDLPAWMRTPERTGQPLHSPAQSCSEDDLKHEGFRARWTAPKRLELHLQPTSRGAAGSGRTRRTGRSAGVPAPNGWTVDTPELIERIRQEVQGGRMVLVFVNQVKRAVKLYSRLRDYDDGGPELALVHARMRPRDRKATYEKLETPVPSEGRIVVATQVLEAGVDLDADALFTELCPWPSLVQRLGRLNRRGMRPSAADVRCGKAAPAPALVFEPLPPDRKQGEPPKRYEERREREAALPYDAKALRETHQRLQELMSAHSGSLSPETLAKFPTSLHVEGPVLRRFDLDDLFDTDPDLSGGHSDIGPFIRAVERDLDAYVLWRRISGGLAPDEQVPIHPDELCPVPFYEAQNAFGDREVWILTLATGRKRGGAWRRANGGEIRAGDTVMVDMAAGCYQQGLGWKPGAKDAPGEIVDRWRRDDGTMVRAWVRFNGGEVSLIEEIDGCILPVRGRHEDPRSFTKRWMKLELHLHEAEKQARTLVTALNLPHDLQRSVLRAACWHDVGKALEREAKGQMLRPFQDMLAKAGRPENGHPKPGVFYAKSNGWGGPPAGFRHELASLLAFLQANQGDDLAAFLILAHHGKVRLMPEAWDEEDPRDLCGVRKGDRIPPVALPCGGSVPLVLDPEALLPSLDRPGWQGRVHWLLHTYGPFFLAYLEGVVRVADWRAS